MIRDIKRFLERVDWTSYPLLRGMEIVGHNVSNAQMVWYSFNVHRLTDFLKFECEPRYIKLVGEAMGRVKWLYVPYQTIENNNVVFYFFPIGFLLHFRRFMWKLWMMPARFFGDRGLLDIKPGDRVPVLWFLRIRFRKGGDS